VTEPVVYSTNKVDLKPRISDMTLPQLKQELHDREQLYNLLPATNSAAEWRAQTRNIDKLVQQARSQMHQQIAFSFSCFAFALVGIAVALLLVLVYYSFVILGSSLSGKPELAPHLIFWLPNFIFQAVGAVLL